jgi:hypothetical protein
MTERPQIWDKVKQYEGPQIQGMLGLKKELRAADIHYPVEVRSALERMKEQNDSVSAENIDAIIGIPVFDGKNSERIDADSGDSSMLT